MAKVASIWNLQFQHLRNQACLHFIWLDQTLDAIKVILDAPRREPTKKHALKSLPVRGSRTLPSIRTQPLSSGETH